MPLENSVVLLNVIADAKAKAGTPRVTLPSNGGLNNPDFVYRSGADIGNRQRIAAERHNLVRWQPMIFAPEVQPARPKVVAIVDRVVHVHPFGGR